MGVPARACARCRAGRRVGIVPRAPCVHGVAVSEQCAASECTGEDVSDSHRGCRVSVVSRRRACVCLVPLVGRLRLGRDTARLGLCDARPRVVPRAAEARDAPESGERDWGVGSAVFTEREVAEGGGCTRGGYIVLYLNLCEATEAHGERHQGEARI